MKTILWPLLLMGLVPHHNSDAVAANLAPQAVSPETKEERDARLNWWREARFGMFIHWGPVTLKGTEISWSRGNPIPVEEYDNLYKEFNPTKFNAEEWVSVAKAAGMKYMVLTAKHWDGFCLWPTKTMDYHIGNSPFRRDVCGELAKAAHAAGIRLGWYYCPADLHDPDCKTDRNAAYIKRMQGQLTELLTDYRPVDLLWFDFAAPPEGSPWDQENTYRLVRKLQPKIIIDNRLDMQTLADYQAQRVGPNADYYTPEQRIGAYDDQTPWETCMTLGTQWSWKPDDQIKSSTECLHILITCASGDGNLLFNVGPMPTGEIEPRQVQRLKEMGEWLGKYGESIYGTRGGPFRNGAWGGATRKDKNVYLHVLKWENDPLELPPLAAKIVSATVLTGGKAEVAQDDKHVIVQMPVDQRDKIDTIIKLEVE